MLLNCDKTREMLVHVHGEEGLHCPAPGCGRDSDREGEDTKVLALWALGCSGTDQGGKNLFLTLLRRARVSPADFVSIFTSRIRSVLEYGCEVWHPGLTQEQSDALEHDTTEGPAHCIPTSGLRQPLSAAGLSRLNQRRENDCRAFFQKMLVPSHMQTPPSHCRQC